MLPLICIALQMQQFLRSLESMAFNSTGLPQGLASPNFDYIYNVGYKVRRAHVCVENAQGERSGMCMRWVRAGKET